MSPYSHSLLLLVAILWNFLGLSSSLDKVSVSQAGALVLRPVWARLEYALVQAMCKFTQNQICDASHKVDFKHDTLRKVTFVTYVLKPMPSLSLKDRQA